MAKGSRGLPANYKISVPENLDRRPPVQLDDYLEDSARVPAAARAKDPKAELVTVDNRIRAEKIVSMPGNDDMRREATRFEPSTTYQGREASASEPRHYRHPPRKQLNLSPETLRMIDELLERIRKYSGQSDAKASEMFHALVSALYEARERLDLQDIPPRGRWGTPTARAFPIATQERVPGCDC